MNRNFSLFINTMAIGTAGLAAFINFVMIGLWIYVADYGNACLSTLWLLVCIFSVHMNVILRKDLNP